jgi:ribonuclease HI
MISIYCDGFLKYKNYRNGCSVGVYYNDDHFVKNTYEMKDVKNKKLNNFIHSNKITTNVAEYFAVFKALLVAKKILKKTDDYITINSDSKLAVYQVNDDWFCRDQTLRVWQKICMDLLESDSRIILEWVTRKANVTLLGH